MPAPLPPPPPVHAVNPAPGTPEGDNFAAEAARHAKRTACLAEARGKKLVGADRNTYVKDCLGH